MITRASLLPPCCSSTSPSAFAIISIGWHLGISKRFSMLSIQPFQRISSSSWRTKRPQSSFKFLVVISYTSCFSSARYFSANCSRFSPQLLPSRNSPHALLSASRSLFQRSSTSGLHSSSCLRALSSIKSCIVSAFSTSCPALHSASAILFCKLSSFINISMRFTFNPILCHMPCRMYHSTRNLCHQNYNVFYPEKRYFSFIV